jgi:hypothetical protein
VHSFENFWLRFNFNSWASHYLPLNEAMSTGIYVLLSLTCAHANLILACSSVIFLTEVFDDVQAKDSASHWQRRKLTMSLV